mgnify:CR=1 FL=1
MREDAHRPIELFITDIDGCLAEPFEALELDRWQELAEKSSRSGPSDPHRPRLTVLSGRPLGYVEAVAQALGCREPALFEAGAGAFDLSDGRVRWNPALTEQIERQMQAVRTWLIEECIPGTALSFDYGKRTQAGVIGPDPEAVERLFPRVEAYVEERFPELRVFETDISIDVVPAAITKRQALDWLAEQTGIPVERMAYIGDTTGDLEALQAVGRSFAPRNAFEAVREQVSLETEGAYVDGVHEAYDWCRAHNARRHEGDDTRSSS